MIVELPPHIRAKLEKQAAARGMTPQMFLKKVLVNVIRDDLYDAVVTD